MAFTAIAFATDVNNPENIYLLEDGMELWLELMRKSSAYSMEMHQLFPQLLAIMDRDFDQLRGSTNLVESYILLGRLQFMNDYAEGVAAALDAVIGNVRTRGLVMITRVLECLVCQFPEKTPQLLDTTFAKLLHASFFAMSCEKAERQDRENWEPDLVVAGYMSILARMLVYTPATFMDFLDRHQEHLRTALTSDSAQADLCTLVADIWIEKMDSVGHSSAGPWRRKAWALALATLLSTGEKFYLDNLENIISICVDVLSEIEDPEASAFIPSPAQNISSDGDGTCGGEGEAKRKHTLFHSDPIFRLDLREFLNESMETCRLKVGDSAFNSALSSVHSSILSHLQK